MLFYYSILFVETFFIVSSYISFFYSCLFSTSSVGFCSHCRRHHEQPTFNLGPFPMHTNNNNLPTWFVCDRKQDMYNPKDSRLDLKQLRWMHMFVEVWNSIAKEEEDGTKSWSYMIMAKEKKTRETKRKCQKLLCFVYCIYQPMKLSVSRKCACVQ